MHFWQRQTGRGVRRKEGGSKRCWNIQICEKKSPQSLKKRTTKTKREKGEKKGLSLGPAMAVTGLAPERSTSLRSSRYETGRENMCIWEWMWAGGLDLEATRELFPPPAGTRARRRRSACELSFLGCSFLIVGAASTHESWLYARTRSSVLIRARTIIALAAGSMARPCQLPPSKRQFTYNRLAVRSTVSLLY